jgi:poly-gamma-glutamate synthase PgsB/CapB
MHGIYVIIGLLIVLSAAEILRRRRHEHYLRQIPIRIHVNGTRGKSSVTRLIAAGLRAGGIRTIAKTTGTKPRFIYDDGVEVPVVRIGKANVIEQLRIVRRAAELEARAIVIECMAVMPELQSLLEDKIIRSTHSVITNARADHLDEMGPTVTDVARNLARTVSTEGELFTSELEHIEILRKTAAERKTRLTVADCSAVTESELAGFGYFEHPENVTLALAVCASFGIDRAVALSGMQRMTPDPGALRIYNLSIFERHIRFINALAMNDPDSYCIVWERLKPWVQDHAFSIILLNCRKDRIQRAEQLGDLVVNNLKADLCLLTGEGTGPVYNRARRQGLPRERLEDLGELGAPEIFERVLTAAEHRPVVVYAIGNIVGLGEEIVNYFFSRGTEIVYRSSS